MKTDIIVQRAKTVINDLGLLFSAYSDETVHPIPGQTEQLFL